MKHLDHIYAIERGEAYFLFYDLGNIFFEISRSLFLQLTRLKEKISENIINISPYLQSFLTEIRTISAKDHSKTTNGQQRASLRLEVSNVCNNKCAYCHVFKISKNRSKKSFMSREIAESSIGDFLELAARYQLSDSFYVNFYGGEPLLVWDLIRTLISKFGLHYKGKRIVWTINTNGRLLKDDMMKFLKKFEVELHMGCDGLKEINDKLRRSDRNQGTFEEIQKAFNMINKYGIYKQINAVISNTNISRLRDIVDIAKKNQIESVYLDVLYRPYKLLNVKRMARAYRDVVNYANQQKIKLGGCCSNLVNKIKSKRILLVQNKYDLLRSISISTDGSIYPILFANSPISGCSLKTYFDENNVLWQKDFNSAIIDLSSKCSSCFLHRYCNFAGILQYRYHTKLEEGHEDSCSFLKEYVLLEMVDEVR